MRNGGTAFSWVKPVSWLVAIAILGLAALLAVAAVTREPIANYADEFWASDATRIARGEYLARAGNCASCHSTAESGLMAGGVEFDTPFGKIYSTNITPDRETGIGTWTGSDFLVSMRRGLRPNGEHLYPVFPYTAFTRITDDDIAALYAYLRSIPSIRAVPPQNEIAFPFNQRRLMAIWNALYLDDGTFVADTSKTAEWNRGAYLVEALAHCSACHSPRNLLGAEERDSAYAGGELVDRVRDGSRHPWSAPNLTDVPNGLGLWTTDELVDYLQTGQNSIVDLFGPMNEVVQNSTRYLRDADIEAMALYLKSLRPVPEPAGAAVDSQIMGMGRTVYNLHCGTCHLPTGLGDAEQAPRIANGSLIVQSENPASLINVILYGPERPHPPLITERRNPMDEFQFELTDAEVAAVASFVRASWGNTGGLVTEDQVARQR